jgi:hypothetical protein
MLPTAVGLAVMRAVKSWAMILPALEVGEVVGISAAVAEVLAVARHMLAARVALTTEMKVFFVLFMNL